MNYNSGFYEDKDLRIARQSALKDAVESVKLLVELHVVSFKDPAELLAMVDSFASSYLTRIYGSASVEMGSVLSV